MMLLHRMHCGQLAQWAPATELWVTAYSGIQHTGTSLSQWEKPTVLIYNHTHFLQKYIHSTHSLWQSCCTTVVLSDHHFGASRYWHTTCSYAVLKMSGKWQEDEIQPCWLCGFFGELLPLFWWWSHSKLARFLVFCTFPDQHRCFDCTAHQWWCRDTLLEYPCRWNSGACKGCKAIIFHFGFKYYLQAYKEEWFLLRKTLILNSMQESSGVEIAHMADATPEQTFDLTFRTFNTWIFRSRTHTLACCLSPSSQGRPSPRASWIVKHHIETLKHQNSSSVKNQVPGTVLYGGRTVHFSVLRPALWTYWHA